MAKVNFKRIEDSSLIDNYDIEDGSFWVTGDGKTYVDYGTERIAIAGTPDTQMSDISRNTVENKVVKEYIDTQINDLNTNLSPILLWSNPNPNNVFSLQQITLNSDDYDMIEVIGISWNATGYRKRVSVKAPKGESLLLTTQFVTAGNSFYIASRVLDHVNDTLYTVDNCRAVDNGNISSLLTNNEVLIPYLIIGYKTGLFDEE